MSVRMQIVPSSGPPLSHALGRILKLTVVNDELAFDLVDQHRDVTHFHGQKRLVETLEPTISHVSACECLAPIRDGGRMKVVQTPAEAAPHALARGPQHAVVKDVLRRSLYENNIAKLWQRLPLVRHWLGGPCGEGQRLGFPDAASGDHPALRGLGQCARLATATPGPAPGIKVVFAPGVPDPPGLMLGHIVEPPVFVGALPVDRRMPRLILLRRLKLVHTVDGARPVAGCPTDLEQRQVSQFAHGRGPGQHTGGIGVLERPGPDP
mmetsp:Transcript_60488/g.197968  ORF Transcript_60488/g.197968 Transcript_60488/m.197968 type:complete len:266 (-) Transcript_60488:1963-2760(-)